MASPYHLDLRKRVMKAIHAGQAKTKVSELFNICRQTIYSWIALEKEQGHLEPKSDYQNGHSHGISDLDSFKQYVNAHSDQTQEEMAEKFSVGSSTIGRTLQKIKYTRKKSVTRTQSAVKKKDVNLRKK